MKVLRRTYFIYFLIPYKEVLWWDTPGWVGRVRATVIGDTFHNKTISKRHTQIFISKQSQSLIQVPYKKIENHFNNKIKNVS